MISSGLVNLGNTCYINSVIQILHTIYELNEYIDINSYNTNINDSIIIKEWKNLKELMDKGVHISPNRFIYMNNEIFKEKNKLEFIQNKQGDSSEYLLFILECIHNSYNLLYTIKDTNSIKDTNIIKELNEYNKKENSIITHLFLSIIEISYLDDSNIKVSKTYDTHWNIDLSIPEKDNLTLYDCLDYTFQKEYLCDDNAWFDDKTNQKKNVYKMTKIVYEPIILVFNLKKWINHDKTIKSKIVFELIIDLSPYSFLNNKYELFGIINYEGNIFGGHYYSITKKRDKWVLFNDNDIKEISIDSLIQSSNYCLFYRKIK